MARVGSLVVELSASVAKFQSDLGKATAIAERNAKRINSVLSGIGATIGGALGAGAFITLAKNTIDAAEAMSELSARSGVSVESLAGFQYAATQTGASTEDFAKAIKFLNKNISEAGTGNKALRSLFQDLGMDAAAEGAINAEQALLQLADVFPRLNDADKVRVAMDLLGKSGEALVPALSGGRSELEEMIATGQRLNPITQEQAKLADDFKDSVARLSTALGVSLLPLLDRLLPILESMNNDMADSAGKSSVMSTAMAGLGKVFETVVVMGSEVAFVLRGVGTEIGGIAAQIGALARFDLGGFRSIGKAMKEDAAAARAEHDKFIASVMGADAKAKQQREALALLDRSGVGLGNEGRARAGGKPNIKLSPVVSGKGKGGAKGKSTGERFIDSLKEQVETFGKTESAMLRYRAGIAGVSKEAEAYIQKLEAMKVAKDEEVARQDAQIASTDDLIASLNRKEMADSDADQVIESLKRSTQEYVAEIDFEASMLGKVAVEQEILTAQRMIDLEVMRASINMDEEKVKKLKELAEEMKKGVEEAIKNKNAGEKMNASLKNGIDRVADAFGNFLETGKIKFKDFIKSILIEQAKIELKKGLTGASSGGGLLSMVLGWVGGGSFGGARANGGPVTGGLPYLVGERGPELFTPNNSGYITPNNRMGGGGIVINTNIDARGADAGMLPKIQAIVEANNRKLEAKILDSRRRNGAFA